MNQSVRWLMCTISLMLLAGCAAPLLGALSGSSSGANNASTASSAASLSANLTPPSIFDQVEKSTRVGLVSPAAFLSENGQLDAAVINSQCRFHTPDPPLLVPSAAAAQKGWVFNGRLDDDRAREMQALEYRSFFGFGWPKQQINTWPVGMTTLSELPDTYLEQRLTMLASAKLDQAEQAALTQRYIGDSRKIEDAVARLEKTYDPEVECVPAK